MGSLLAILSSLPRSEIRLASNRDGTSKSIRRKNGDSSLSRFDHTGIEVFLDPATGHGDEDHREPGHEQAHADE